MQATATTSQGDGTGRFDWRARRGGTKAHSAGEVEATATATRAGAGTGTRAGAGMGTGRRCGRRDEDGDGATARDGAAAMKQREVGGN